MLADRIKALLSKIHNNHKEISLESVDALPKTQFRKYLSSLGLIDRATIDLVLKLRRSEPIVPVDKESERLLVRLGIVPRKLTVRQKQKALKRLVPEDQIVRFHRSVLDLARDLCRENEEELNMRMEEWTRNLTAEEIMEKLQAAGVPAGVVKNAADVLSDPQLANRHYFQQLEHPEIGMHYYEGVGGCNLSKTPGKIRMPAPLLGQHTNFVCQELLGMNDEEFLDLFNQGR